MAVPSKKTATTPRKAAPAASKATPKSKVAPKPKRDPTLPSGVWEVEAIIDHRVRGKDVLYRVRWKGFSQSDDTWEPVKNLAGSQQALKAYQSTMSESPDVVAAKRAPSPSKPATKRQTGGKASGKSRSSASTKSAAKTTATKSRKRR